MEQNTTATGDTYVPVSTMDYDWDPFDDRVKIPAAPAQPHADPQDGTDPDWSRFPEIGPQIEQRIPEKEITPGIPAPMLDKDKIPPLRRTPEGLPIAEARGAIQDTLWY